MKKTRCPSVCFSRSDFSLVSFNYELICQSPESAIIGRATFAALKFSNFCSNLQSFLVDDPAC